MPIYSVRERNMQLPRIGTIRKGIKANVMRDGKPVKGRDGHFKTYPKEVPWLVFNIDPNDEKTAAQLNRAYGPEKERFAINVYLPYPEAMQAWDFWLEAYVYSQMVARSDGRIITFLRDIVTSEVLVRDGVVFQKSSDPNTTAGKLVANLSVGDEVPYIEGMAVAGNDKKAVTFKASGRLQVVLPALKRLATFTVMTGSLYYDIPKIDSTMQMVQAISQAKGIPANTIPLILRRIPMEVSVPTEDGSRKRVTKHMLELELHETFAAPYFESLKNVPQLMYTPAEDNGKPVLELESGDIEEDYEIEAEVDDIGPDENFAPRGDVSRFWQHVRSNGISDDIAASVIRECKNDFDKAYDVVVKQHTPPTR